LPSVEVIKELTRDQIINIYRGEFWNVGFFEKIVEQRICNYIFDMCISHGFKQAIILVQRAGWAAIHHYNYVEDDGSMGINTLTVINLWSNGNLLLYSFISSLCAERAGYCRLLVAIDALNKEFLDGWLRRCYRI
jgi:lysozyme family protein